MGGITKKCLGTTSSDEDVMYADDVFSTRTYVGNGSSQKIQTGIDLTDSGGLIWTKSGSTGNNNILVNTITGVNNYMSSNTVSQQTTNDVIKSVEGDGYTVGSFGMVNNASVSHYSWSFKRSPRFFDVVTYTGNGIPGNKIYHSLNCEPGMIIVKRRSVATNGGHDGSWFVYHRSLETPERSTLYLNEHRLREISSEWNNTKPTETHFLVNGNINFSGVEYVAYLFAHDESEASIIRCGSYTSVPSYGEIPIGFEPQFMLIKKCEIGTVGQDASDWVILDDSYTIGQPFDRMLYPNRSEGIDTLVGGCVPTPNGIRFNQINSVVNQQNGSLPPVYVYVAIRRPTKPPKTGSDVFQPILRTGDGNTTIKISNVPFKPDLVSILKRNGTEHRYLANRVNSPFHLTTSTVSGESTSLVQTFNDSGVTIRGSTYGVNQFGFLYVDLFFKRSPGVLEILEYKGTGIPQTDVKHSLGVKPELCIIKARDMSSSWCVASPLITRPGYPDQPAIMLFHRQYPATQIGGLFFGNGGDESFTEDHVRITGSSNVVDQEGSIISTGLAEREYMMFLFASFPGVSKVGSYTGNGTTQTIDCGFTTGSRFIMIKRMDANSDWFVWDSARGILSGNDPTLSFNNSATEITGIDVVDPHPSGFIVNQESWISMNVQNSKYLFLSFS